MNATERLFARINGLPVDRIPNLSIVMLFVSEYTKIPYGQIVTDYRALTEAHLKVTEDFDLDILSTMSDPFRETADFGAKLVYQENDLPLCPKPLLQDISQFQSLKLWEPTDSVRILDRIRAIETFRRCKGKEYPVLGWIEAPLAEMCDLMSVQEGLAALIEEPEEAEEAMNLLAEQAIRCALAQIEAGADVIGMGDASASLISPNMYREYVQPVEKRIIDAIQSHGAICKLHICGNTNHILKDMIDTGARIVDIDYMVDFAQAVKLADGKTSICGNLDPVAVLLQGTEEDVRREIKLCVDASDNKSIISSGCEVPRFTSPAQLQAIAHALRDK